MNEKLLELEDLLWKANREGDGDFYEKYLLGDAVAVTKFGIIDKATAVPLVDGNEVELPSYASTVWTDVHGDWRIAFHQQTAL